MEVLKWICGRKGKDMKKINKTLEECMDDSLKVSDIIEYCNRSAEVECKMKNSIQDKILETGGSESEESCLNTCLWREEMYRNGIPNAIVDIINRKLNGIK